jgi:hypothetical protein
LMIKPEYFSFILLRISKLEILEPKFRLMARLLWAISSISAFFQRLKIEFRKS